MSKKILLTGATGFLGSHLLESFILQDFEVVILKRTTSVTNGINHLLEKAKTYNIDEVKLELVFEEFQPEIVVHTACSYGRKSEALIDIVNANLMFGLELLQHSVKNNVKTFINTDSLLPRNINQYSLSKAQFTDWLKFYVNEIQIINFKIEHMYGVKDDNKKFIPWLISKMVTEMDIIHLTSGVQKRDFIYVTDVVSAYNLTIERVSSLPAWNEFDVGTGSFTEVKELVISIAEQLERKYKKEILSRLCFGSVPYRKEEIMIPQIDTTKLTNLGWEYKVALKDGLAKIINDYK